MMASLTFTARQYLTAYQRYAIDFWEHITPMQYGCILIGVAVVGYIMMKSGK